MAREEKLVLKLEERIKFQFQQMADKYGVTMSALGAYAIGQFIDAENRRRALEEQVMAGAVQTMQSGLEKQMSDELSDAQLAMLEKGAPAFVEMIKQIAMAAEK